MLCTSSSYFTLTEEILFEVSPKSTVSYAVDEWTNGSRDDLCHDVENEKKVRTTYL